MLVELDHRSELDVQIAHQCSRDGRSQAGSNVCGVPLEGKQVGRETHGQTGRVRRRRDGKEVE